MSPDGGKAARVARFGLGVFRERAQDRADEYEAKAEDEDLHALRARYEGKAQVWSEVAHVLSMIDSAVWEAEVEYVTDVYEEVAEAVERDDATVEESREAREA